MTTTTATTAPKSVTFDEALAYLGGPLFDALKADGHHVSVSGRTIHVGYDATRALMAVTVAEGQPHGRHIIKTISNVEARKRAGIYEFNNEGRINLVGLMSNIRKDKTAYGLELEAAAKAQAQREAESAMAEANTPLAEKLAEGYAQYDASGEPFIPAVQWLHPSRIDAGHVTVHLRPSLLNAPEPLARALLDALLAIHEHNTPAPTTSATAGEPIPA